MPSIDVTARLADVIRTQIASLRDRKGARQAAGKRPAASAERQGDVAADVAARIRSVDAADPDRERKAFRMFLEAVLISELGAKIAEDPQFAAMVEHVQGSMEADPEIARAAQQAARVLLKIADGPAG
jgi:hypothetical protein